MIQIGCGSHYPPPGHELIETSVLPKPREYPKRKRSVGIDAYLAALNSEKAKCRAPITLHNIDVKVYFGPDPCSNSHQ